MQQTVVRIILVVVAVALSGGIAACGDDDDAGSNATQASADEGGASASKELEALYKGTFSEPPATSPTPPKDKSIWVISCGQSVTGCSVAANAKKEAAESLGWEVRLWDGKLDPNLMLTGIRQAITAKADAITGFAIDCPTVQAGLKEAKAAGIPYVAVESFDCNDVKSGAPSLFTHVVQYGDLPYPKWIESYGAAQATWLIAKLGGKAKVIEFYENDTQALQAIHRGFVRKMESCSGCEIVDTVTFTFRDLGPSLQQKAQQAVLQNPDANGVAFGYDALLTSGVLAGLRASGRLDDLEIMGAEGAIPNLDLMRKGQGQDAGVATPPEWEAYAAIDAIVRLLAGEEPVIETGLGVQVYDKDHNLPDSGPYVPVGADGQPIDFRGAYEDAWKQGG